MFLTINGMAPSIVSAGTVAGFHSTEYFPLAISPLCKWPGKRGEPPSPGCILCLAPSASTLPSVPQSCVSRVTLATGVLLCLCLAGTWGDPRMHMGSLLCIQLGTDHSN